MSTETGKFRRLLFIFGGLWHKSTFPFALLTHGLMIPANLLDNSADAEYNQRHGNPFLSLWNASEHFPIFTRKLVWHVLKERFPISGMRIFHPAVFPSGAWLPLLFSLLQRRRHAADPAGGSGLSVHPRALFAARLLDDPRRDDRAADHWSVCHGVFDAFVHADGESVPP